MPKKKSIQNDLTKLRNSRKRSIMFRDFLLGPDEEKNISLYLSEQNVSKNGSRLNFKVRKKSKDINMIEVTADLDSRFHSKSKTKSIESRGIIHQQDIDKQSKHYSQKDDRNSKGHMRSKKADDTGSTNQENVICSRFQKLHQTVACNAVHKTISMVKHDLFYNRTERQKIQASPNYVDENTESINNTSNTDQMTGNNANLSCQNKEKTNKKMFRSKFNGRTNSRSYKGKVKNQKTEPIKQIYTFGRNQPRTLVRSKNRRENDNYPIYKIIPYPLSKNWVKLGEHLAIPVPVLAALDPHRPEGYYCLDPTRMLCDTRDRYKKKNRKRSISMSHVISVNHLVKLDEPAISLIERNRTLEQYAKQLTSKWEREMSVSENSYGKISYIDNKYQSYKCDNKNNRRRSVSTRGSRESNFIKIDKRTDPTPFIINNLSELQSEIEHVSHILSRANQNTDEHDTQGHHQYPIGMQPKYHSVEELPRFKKEASNYRDKERYFSSTSSEETIKYKQGFRFETKPKDSIHLYTIHKQKKTAREKSEYFNQKNVNSFTPEASENENVVTENRAGTGRTFKYEQKPNPSALEKSRIGFGEQYLEDPVMSWFTKNEAVIKAELTKDTVGSETTIPHQVSFGEIYFPRRQPNYENTNNMEDNEKFSLNQCQYFISREHINTINRKNPSLCLLQTNGKAFCPTSSFIFGLRQLPSTISCTDEILTRQKDTKKEKSQNVEHLLESVKAIGQQYYGMSSKTMIPVLRKVQNKVICRFYNLRQYINQNMQSYIQSFEDSARRYIESYEKEEFSEEAARDCPSKENVRP